MCDLTLQTNLGAMLATYRQTRGLTLDEMATATRLDRTALWRIEQGKSVSLMTWLSLEFWLLSPATIENGLVKNGFNAAQSADQASPPVERATY